MKISRAAAALAFAFALTRSLACASGDDDELAPGPEEDAATPAPSTTSTAGTPDAASPPKAVDAGADAAPDAATVIPCSADRICTTLLPGPTPDADGGVPNGVHRDLDLRSVWMDGSGDAFAVSASGDLIGWHAGAWRVLLETGRPLHHVWAETEAELWIASDDGVVLRATRGQDGSYTTVAESTGFVGVVDGFLGHGDHLWLVTGPGALRTRDALTGTWHDDPYPFDAVGPDRSATVEAIFESGGEIWARGQQFGCEDCDLQLQHLLLHWEPGASDAGAGDASTGDAADDDAGLVPSDWRTVHLGGANLFAGGVSAGVGPSTFLLCASYACDQVARVSPGEGGFASTLETTGTNGGIQALGLWSGSAADAWLVGTRGTVKHYDGAAWSLARIAYLPFPTLTDLRAVTGRNGEVWIVGDNLALHKEAP